MFMLLSLHLIGVEKWCNYNPDTKVMQCNYESKSVCEAYTEGNEVCRVNPNYKDK
jgi:hypothetical protein